MIINRFDIYHIRRRLKDDWVTSYGKEIYIEGVLVKAYSKDLEAWVETSPLAAPFYSSETATTAYYMIETFFAPLIVDKDIQDAQGISKILSQFRGNNFAKAGVEQCWWALQSLQKQVPLCKLFKSTNRDIEVARGLGVADSIATLIRKIGLANDQGYKRIKLKIQRGADIEVVRTVRHEFPYLHLHVDCNGAYNLDDLLLFKQLDILGLDMIEQPFHCRDIHDHAELQKHLTTPICLDESITCATDAELAIRYQACRVMCIKIGRVGGIYEALRIYQMCTENNIPCWIGGMFETGIGASINIEFATLPNCVFPNEISLNNRFVTGELMTPPIVMENDGTVKSSHGSYVDRLVNEDIVDGITLQKTSIEAS